MPKNPLEMMIGRKISDTRCQAVDLLALALSDGGGAVLNNVGSPAAAFLQTTLKVFHLVGIVIQFRGTPLINSRQRFDAPALTPAGTAPAKEALESILRILASGGCRSFRREDSRDDCSQCPCSGVDVDQRKRAALMLDQLLATLCAMETPSRCLWQFY
jgi:hypothetical protein